MTLLQLGIGVTNDLVDAPHDAGRKPGKPIAAGLVGRQTALRVALGLFAAGLVLGASVGPVVGLLSVVVVGIGLAYDLRLKGSAWSWLPFAVGIPILPAYGWIGATGGLAPPFIVLLPAAVAAGAALAIGNALVDVERDRASGISSVAVALGGRTAQRAVVGLLAGVLIAAVGSALAVGSAGMGASPRPIVLGLVVAGGLPVAAAWVGAGRSPVAREWAWRVEAIGLATLAGLWLANVLG
jgi:4-hydroxybenzoate polyprenyltransferase